MTRSIGIDVGASLIRIAEIESSGRTRRLVGLYELTRDENTPPGAALRAFFESSGISAERIGLGTDSHPLVLRSFEFPFANLKKVESAIQGEFEDTLPISDFSKHVLDVRPFGKVGRTYRFLAGLMTEDALKAMDTISDDSGMIINAYMADVEAMGQLALNQNLPAAASNSAYAVVDLGYSSTKIAFLKGARPKFLNRKARDEHAAQIVEMRVIGRGSRDLVEWIREKNALSHEEALQWLIHRAEILDEDAAPGSLTGDISDEIKTALRPVVVELYQTFQSFKAQHGETPFAVYLTGGLSGLKGLREFLASELRASFHTWPIFEGFETAGVPLSVERERSFAVALSIAHRWAAQSGGGWLNFKRMTAQRKLLSSFVSQLMNPEPKRVLAGIALSLAAVFAYNWASAWFLGEQLDKVRNDLVGEFRKLDRDLGKRAPNFVGDPKRAREVFEQERKKRLAAVDTGPSGPKSRSRSDVLMDVSDAVPSNLTLKEFLVRDTGPQGLTIEGKLATKAPPKTEEVPRILERLSQSLRGRGYSDVTLEASPSDRKLLVMRTKWKGGR